MVKNTQLPAASAFRTLLLVPPAHAPLTRTDVATGHLSSHAPSLLPARLHARGAALSGHRADLALGGRVRREVPLHLPRGIQEGGRRRRGERRRGGEEE